MALPTAETLIKAAYRNGIGLDADVMDNLLIALGVDYYNLCGKTIFDRYPWDERKIDRAEVSPSSGIITFGSTVDTVIAIRPKANNTANDNNYAIWAQDQVNAYLFGQEVSSSSFVYLAPDSSDNRRIRVNTDDNVTTYYAITTKRFVEATVESSYSAGNPSATPTDYRVIQWQISHATEIMKAYMADKYRVYNRDKATNEWVDMLKVEIDKVDAQQATDQQIVPECPMFSDLGMQTYVSRTDSTLKTS